MVYWQAKHTALQICQERITATKGVQWGFGAGLCLSLNPDQIFTNIDILVKLWYNY